MFHESSIVAPLPCTHLAPPSPLIIELSTKTAAAVTSHVPPQPDPHDFHGITILLSLLLT